MLGWLGNFAGILFGQDNELRQTIFLTLKMSLFSTLISAFMGVTSSICLTALQNNGIKRFLERFVNTLMGIPPVVAGVIVFLLLSRNGPLGSLGILFSLKAMIIAQVFLITPIVMGLSIPIFNKKREEIFETVKGLNINKLRMSILMLNEVKIQIIGITLSAFGRSIAEVGAVSLVGGNVQYKTRIMTTAIMLETNRGNFQHAIILGIILLLCSLVVNVVVLAIVENEKQIRVF